MKIRRKVGPGGLALKNVTAQLSTQKGKVGWFPGDYPDGGPPVASVAAKMEFGEPSQNIPPRPMLRPTITNKQTEWAQKIKASVIAMLKGKIDPKYMMELFVLVASGDVRETIKNIHEPPLSQVTIDNRIMRLAEYERLKTRKAKHEKIIELREKPTLKKPLVDTKLLLNSCIGVVESKK